MSPETFEQLLNQSSLGRPTVVRLASRAPRETVSAIRTEVEAAIARDLSDRPGPIAVAADSTPTQDGHHTPAQQKETNMPSRKTSAKAASAASKVLRDGRTSGASKTAAGSALSQRAPKSGKGR